MRNVFTSMVQFKLCILFLFPTFVTFISAAHLDCEKFLSYGPIVRVFNVYHDVFFSQNVNNSIVIWAFDAKMGYSYFLADWLARPIKLRGSFWKREIVDNAFNPVFFLWQQNSGSLNVTSALYDESLDLYFNAQPTKAVYAKLEKADKGSIYYQVEIDKFYKVPDENNGGKSVEFYQNNYLDDDNSTTLAAKYQTDFVIRGIFLLRGSIYVFVNTSAIFAVSKNFEVRETIEFTKMFPCASPPPSLDVMYLTLSVCLVILVLYLIYILIRSVSHLFKVKDVVMNKAPIKYYKSSIGSESSSFSSFNVASSSSVAKDWKKEMNRLNKLKAEMENRLNKKKVKK